MKPLFNENQKFKQIWVWILLFACLLYVSYEAWQQQTTQQYVAVGIVLLVMLLFYFMQLKTTLYESQLKIKFIPFLQRTILWPEVEEAKVEKYSAFGEFGGYGVRIGWNKRAYNIAGKSGLILHLKNGKKIVIGTQKPDEFEKALSQTQAPIP